MKTILFCTALTLLGCGSKKGAGNCAEAIGKGVDTMMAAGAKRMENAPPEQKAKMEEAAVKLKGVITNRCTEDKWPAEVVDCYSTAQKREDLRNCRAKLPPESAAKLQKEEMEVMIGAGFGGMRPHGMGAGGSGDHPESLQGNAPAMGSATAPAMGSATAPAAGSATK
ncbi:MAG: hypothetical protein ABI591_33300 [Kofleriaceae bacterium]